MRGGFHGYLTKQVPLPELANAIRTVVGGENIVKAIAQPSPSSSVEDRDMKLLAKQLTDHEKQVLGLLVQGATSPAIASALSVSPNTVRTHIQNVLTKLQVHSRLEAAALAARFGLVDTSSAVGA